jgi:hypothetical protein
MARALFVLQNNICLLLHQQLQPAVCMLYHPWQLPLLAAVVTANPLVV